LDLGAKNLLIAVLADGIHRATFESFHAKGDFVLRGGLLVDERVTTLVMTGKKVWCSLAAEITIYALLINEKFAANIIFPFVGFVCHVGAKQDVRRALSSGHVTKLMRGVPCIWGFVSNRSQSIEFCSFNPRT